MHRRTCTLPLGSALAALLFALMSAAAVAAPPSGYTLAPVAFLGDPAPGGGQFTSYFAPGPLNSRGDLAFDAPTAVVNGVPQEAIFLATGGKILPIMRHGQPAPGGGTFGAVEFGYLGLNDAGDVALAFSLEPLANPLGVNGGLYRWSHTSQTLTPVVIPKVTPAPGGGTFAGVEFDVALNNQGAIAFYALTATDKGIHVAGEDYVGYGSGVYVADALGKITTVAAPGDPAPGGSTFDFVAYPYLNDGGDILFVGHRVTDPVGAQVAPQATSIAADANVYLKHAASGQIETIASIGDPLPGGGMLVSGSFVAGLNNAGDILFVNFLNPADVASPLALYLRSGGQTARVAGPGDAMPGGGKITLTGAASLNNMGDVAFNAALDTKEEGVYLYSKGVVSLIAKTGTAIPGVGTLFDLEQGNPEAAGIPALPAGAPTVFLALSDQGQVAFPATLKDGRIALLVATPTP